MSTKNQITSIISSSGNTNNPPSSSDRATLTRYRSSLDRDIDSLNKDIAALTVRRDALVADRTHCTEILSPLRRFPDELLLEIFDYLRCQGKAVAVHRLARVCSSWRTIVLRSPTLWRSVDLSDGRGIVRQKFTLASFLERLASHIQRSQDLPMELIVGSFNVADLDVLMEHIFSSVKSHWTSISIYAHHVHILHRVIAYYNKFPNEVECLSHASFEADHIEGVPQLVEEGGTLDFTIFTKLRSLGMRMGGFIASRRAFPVNWDSLLHLYLRSQSTSEDYIQHVLRHCPNLESLFITPKPSMGDSIQGLTLTLKKLKKLTVATRMSGVPSFLLALSAPLLEDFRLDLSRYMNDPTGTIGDFLERHQGNLRTFRCGGSVMGHFCQTVAPGKTDPFQFLSRITTLHLHDQVQMDERDYSVYYDLAAYGIEKLPNLRRIEFEGHTMAHDIERQHMVILLSAFEKMGEDRRIIWRQRVWDRPPVNEELDKFKEKGILVVQKTVMVYP